VPGSNSCICHEMHANAEKRVFRDLCATFTAGGGGLLGSL
jgi:hypothetical protein